MKIIRLKDLRTFYDLSQEDIAKILGVKRGTYASWECGSDTIPIKQLYKLANYYEKSIDYILYITDERKPYPKSIINKKVPKHLISILIYI